MAKATLGIGMIIAFIAFVILLIGFMFYGMVKLKTLNDCLTTPVTELSEQCRNLIYKGDM